MIIILSNQISKAQLNEYLRDLFGKKQGEILKNTCHKRQTISDVSSNTTPTLNNSLQTNTIKDAAIQLATTTATTTEVIDHRSFVIQSINQWCLKHADEIGISDSKLVDGTDYVVTLSSGLAHIRCGCRGSARLSKQGSNCLISNFYRHLKGRRYSMLKAKQQIHNINSSPSNSVSIDEETSSQRTTAENIPVLFSDSVVAHLREGMSGRRPLTQSLCAPTDEKKC